MESVQLPMMPMPGAKLKQAHSDALPTFFGGRGTINVYSWSPGSTHLAFVTYEPIKDGGTK